MKVGVFRIVALLVVAVGLLSLNCGEEPEIDNDEGPVLPSGWHSMSAIDSPDPRNGHVSVWTGDRKIVWGGTGDELFVDGGLYDPDEDQWSSMATDGAPEGRLSTTAVWTGEEMLVWGGGYYDDVGDFHTFSDGAGYNPADDEWTALEEAPIEARSQHMAVWTGEEMIVWGGVNSDGQWLDDGAGYDPEADEWWTIEGPSDYVARRTEHTGVWTGDEMLVWGGVGGDEPVDDGWKYDPGEGEWTEMAAVPDDVGNRSEFSTVWTGEKMVVWGGVANYEAGEFATGGGIYDPSEDSWEKLDAPATVENHVGATGVWTGEEVIFWGGVQGPDIVTSRGVRIDVEDGSVETLTDSAPMPRVNHSAVWTGAEMLIFGGWFDEGVFLDDGWLFVP